MYWLYNLHGEADLKLEQPRKYVEVLVLEILHLFLEQLIVGNSAMVFSVHVKTLLF